LQTQGIAASSERLAQGVVALFILVNEHRLRYLTVLVIDRRIDSQLNEA
jgi:hypothetical protein